MSNPFSNAIQSGGSSTWQLLATPMRGFVSNGRGGRFRPVMGVLVDRGSGFCFGIDLGKEDEPPHDVAARVLFKTLRDAGGAAPTVQVRDPELATALRRRQELSHLAFEVVEQLEMVEQMVAQMEQDLDLGGVAKKTRGSQSGPLEQPGTSLERLGAFAEAGALFYRAAPWRHLQDEDVIEVEAPKAPAGMRALSVLGAGGQTVGIGFYRNVEGYERLAGADDPMQQVTKEPRWALLYYGADEMPLEEVELWDEHGLPVVRDERGEDAAPMLLRFRGRTQVDRPDGATLTFVEGLCRALASTSEAELDAGRWEKSVQTFDGAVTYRLTIPHLLEPPAPLSAMDVLGPANMEQSMQQIMRLLQQSGAGSIAEMNAFLDRTLNQGKLPKDVAPQTDQQRAMDLCYQAHQARGRRELQLVREALKLDPNCAEAYLILATRESDPSAAEALLRQGIEAGRRTVGEEAFTVPGYPFWGALESRPFMRALAGLAEVLEEQGRNQEAADVLREMLKLNPGDNQGIRYRYVPLLIRLGRLDEAREVVESKEYRDDAFALWDYAAALIAHRQGRTADADAALKRAMERNPHVVGLILNPDRMPPTLPEAWSPGKQSEAVVAADLLGDVWAADVEALRWLARSVPKSPARAKGAKGGKKSDGNRKGKGKRR